jgi:hypothetical protein
VPGNLKLAHGLPLGKVSYNTTLSAGFHWFNITPGRKVENLIQNETRKFNIGFKNKRAKMALDHHGPGSLT